MPQYLSPGVYVEEIDAGPRPIASVATSMAGMVGVTARGPVDGKPLLVTSFRAYQQTFGGFVPEPPTTIRDRWQNPANTEGGRWWLFPLAVRGFFDNGGQQLFVKRVAAHGAATSTATLQGGLLADVDSAPAAATELILQHLVGVQNGTALTVHYRDGGNPATQVVAVTAYDAQRLSVTFTAPGLTREVRAGQAVVQIGALDATPTVRVAASAPGTWGDGVQVRVRPSVTPFSLLADPGQGLPFFTQVAATSAADAGTVAVSPVPGLAVGPPAVPAGAFFAQIGPGRFEISGIAAAGANIALTLRPDGAGNTPHRQWDPPLAVRRVRRANAVGGGTTLRVAGANSLYVGAVLELDNGTAKETRRITAIQGDTVTFNTAVGEYFEGQKAYLIEAAVTASFTDEGVGLTEETFPNLHLQRVAPSDPLGLEAVVNGRAQLVRLTQLADVVTAPQLLLPAPSAADLAAGRVDVPLAAGNNDYDNLAVSDFVGVDGGSGHRTGIESLVDIDEVAIAAVPGMWSGTVQCEADQPLRAADGPVRDPRPARQPVRPTRCATFRNAVQHPLRGALLPVAR